MKLFQKRKGLSLAEAPYVAILLVVAGVAAALGARLTANVQSGSTGEAANVAANATAGISQLAQQFPNIGLVAGFAIIIGLLLGAFVFLKRGQ